MVQLIPKIINNVGVTNFFTQYNSHEIQQGIRPLKNQSSLEHYNANDIGYSVTARPSSEG